MSQLFWNVQKTQAVKGEKETTEQQQNQFHNQIKDMQQYK